MPTHDIPTVEEYCDAFRTVAEYATVQQRALLRAQYFAPQRSATATNLALLTGAKSHVSVNREYGALGRRVAQAIGFDPPQRLDGSRRWWRVLSDGHHLLDGRWSWTMHVPVAQALERAGWINAEDGLCPDESVPAGDALFEGARRAVVVNAYERNPEARRRCLAAHGAQCAACGFRQEVVYQHTLARIIVQVHHLTPFSGLVQERDVDPIEDLRPLCPNCHAVAHARTPPYSIAEIQAMLAVVPSAR